MAAPQRFRSALNGFNREDVVNYIEYLNNHYNTQLEQLNNQLREANGTVSADELADLQAQLDAALQRCGELEEKLSAQESTVSKELEAYRRAEEAERMANARAKEIYAKAHSALTEATAMTEAAAEAFSQVAQCTSQQLQECQSSISATVNSFQSAVASLNAVDPE